MKRTHQAPGDEMLAKAQLVLLFSSFTFRLRSGEHLSRSHLDVCGRKLSSMPGEEIRLSSRNFLQGAFDERERVRAKEEG